MAPPADASSTLQAGDSITGTGANNTLRIIDTTTVLNNGLAGVTLSGVQTVTVQKTDSTAASTYNLAATAGVTTVQNVNSSAAAATIVNFTGLTAGTTVSVSGANTALGTTTAAYTVGASPVLVNLNGGLTTVQTITANTGTNTAATVSSTGGVNGVATTGAAANAVLSLSAVGQLNSLTVNAATNMRATLTNVNFNTATGADLVVSGAATSVNLGNLGIYKTINAAGLTAGGLTVNASTTLTAFTGGGGNDTLTGNQLGAAGANNAAINATAVINAGAGRDTLAATLVNAGNGAVFSGFEVLATANGFTANAGGVTNLGANVQLDASLLTNSTITGVNIGGTSAAVAGVGSVISNLVMTSTPFTVAVNGTSNANATVDLVFTAPSVIGTTDTIAYTFAGTSVTPNNIIVNAGVVTHQGVELVTIASGGIAGMTNVLAITDNALQSVTVTGARGLTLTTNGQDLIGTATVTALTTINASGMTPAAAAGLTFTETTTTVLGSLSGLTITGSSANDTITVVTLGAGTLLAPGATNNFGADTVILTLGGIDVVDVTGANSQLGTGVTAAAFAATTVTGVTTGDAIDFGGVQTLAAGTAAVNVTAQTTLIGAVNAAVDGIVGTNEIAYFRWSGNTFVVAEEGTAVGFDELDIVVQLTGIVDLSTSAAVAGVLTIA